MVRTVTADEAQRMLASGHAVAVDALPAQSHALRRLPGAVNLDPNDADFDAKARKLVPDTKTTLITYCSDKDCPASGRAAARLHGLGYEDVREFPGGLRGWRQAGFDWERPPDAPPPRKVRADTS
jgi:rhodanese-related sulfurtransferase